MAGWFELGMWYSVPPGSRDLRRQEDASTIEVMAAWRIGKGCELAIAKEKKRDTQGIEGQPWHRESRGES